MPAIWAVSAALTTVLLAHLGAVSRVGELLEQNGSGDSGARCAEAQEDTTSDPHTEILGSGIYHCTCDGDEGTDTESRTTTETRADDFDERGGNDGRSEDGGVHETKTGTFGVVEEVKPGGDGLYTVEE